MVCSRVQLALSDCFEAWGRFVARRPWVVLFASGLLALASMAGTLTMKSASAAVDLWAIRHKGFRDYEYMDTCCGGQPSFIVVFCERVGPGSIFDREAVLEMIKVHNWTTRELTVSLPNAGRSITFDDVCHRRPLETVCSSSQPSASLLGLWQYTASLVPATDAAVLAQIDALHQVSTVAAFAGDLQVSRDAAGRESVLSSRGVSLGFSVHQDSAGDYKAFEAAFNDISTGVSTAADSSIIRVTHFSNHGLDLENGRTVAKDISLFVVALNLVCVFLGLTLGRTRRIAFGPLPLAVPDLVGGRWMLAWMALGTVGLSAVAGIGLAALMGATFHSVVSLLPLIVLGVQVDDCVITVNQLSLVAPSELTIPRGAEGSVAERFSKSLRESGPCITTTSLTTVTAFAIGISAALPGVSYFCMYATAVFFFGWLFQVTFFYAAVVLDERRIERRGCCALPCVTVRRDGKGASTAPEGVANRAAAPTEPNSSGQAEGSAFQAGMHTFSTWLMHPAASLAVFVLFVGLAATAGALVSRISIGLPLEDILPDDSYIREAFRVEDTVFKGRSAPVAVIVKAADFNDGAARTKFRDAVTAVGKLPFVLSTYPHWMDAYESWTAATGANHASYLEGMPKFLNTSGATFYQDHVKCTDPQCSALDSAKFEMLAQISPAGTAIIEQLKTRTAIETALASVGYSASEVIVYAFSYMFAETDDQTLVAVLSSCGLAILGVFLVMCLSTSMLIALWVALCVAMIDVDLLLVVYLWSMRLNSITYTCLVMACGLAVDYCVHIGHAFEHALRSDPRMTPRDAAKTALVRMGASVFQGGFTTFLGTLVIAIASSVAFRTFFRLIFATVLLGVSHGMLLLPVLLAYATPRWATSAASPAGASKAV